MTQNKQGETRQKRGKEIIQKSRFEIVEVQENASTNKTI